MDKRALRKDDFFLGTASMECLVSSASLEMGRSDSLQKGDGSVQLLLRACWRLGRVREGREGEGTDASAELPG